MALFTVELRSMLVVEADDESHAYEVARSHKTVACMDSDPHIDVIGEVTEVRHLPCDWDEKCLPYGGTSPSKTIGEILET